MKKIKTGGPAFARPCSVDRFSRTVIPEQAGMTLRDYFAGQVLITLAGDYQMSDDLTAEICYRIADAMLKAREATDE
jgi:hypothetical protein